MGPGAALGPSHRRHGCGGAAPARCEELEPLKMKLQHSQEKASMIRKKGTLVGYFSNE